MDTTFMNLKKDYKDFVKQTASEIAKLNIDDELTESKCVAIFNLYETIKSNIESSQNLNINDINHILLNCKKNDENLAKIKKFVEIKNMYIIKKAMNSSLWNSFVTKLMQTIDLGDENLNKKKTKLLVSKGVCKLLCKTKNQFKGCWEIVELNGKKIKKIEIVEPEHYDFLVNYIKNNITTNTK